MAISESPSVPKLAIGLVFVLLTVCSSVDAGIDISQINVNDIQQQLPPEFANSNLTFEDVRSFMRDKCIQVSGKDQGAEAYQEIETATLAMAECITSIVNYTAIQAEIDEASPRGELDVVFNKYCNRRPEALDCVEKFNSKLAPCLDKDEQENQEVFMRIVRSLLNFICHKGGDQIALFIAEKGPECLESKKDDIQQCINSTFSGYMPEDGLESVKSLPKLVMGQKQCDDMQRLQICIVEKLETCSEITPANIVESMFRFIKNETICRTTASNTVTAAKHAGHSSAKTLLELNGTAMALLMALFYVISKRLTA